MNILQIIEKLRLNNTLSKEEISFCIRLYFQRKLKQDVLLKIMDKDKEIANKNRTAKIYDRAKNIVGIDI